MEEQWVKLSKLNFVTPKILRLYSSFIIEILNDRETGSELLIKAKEAANLRGGFDATAGIQDANDVSNYVQDGTPCIYISGEIDNLGEVI